MNILIVDDEKTILDVIEAYLIQGNNVVLRAQNGTDALRIFEKRSIDFVVLDIMLPDISGWEICKEIRNQSTVPIILLTAKTSEEDVLKGLREGADDYITKPFSPRELVARMETITRRTNQHDEPKKLVFNKGDFIIRPDTQDVFVNDKRIVLTNTEFQLLNLMAQEPYRVFTRDRLLETIKGVDAIAMDRVIDSHIKNLRAKIEKNPKKPMYIETVHGLGYRFGGEK
jgi:DNA-binding response OmpR family regulator